tara:strand:- start:2736 stop:3593 length:858 start_codon:yes stop_codon:yes gene_type:complete
MATWNNQIADMAGLISNGESTATHMDNAVKDVINKLARINPEMMHMFSANVNNSSGEGFVTITDNNMIFKVARREGSVYRTCSEAPSSLEADLLDDDSLNKATAEYPRFIRSNSKITVFPQVTTANYISVTKVVYGAVSGLTSGNGEIANFPSGMYPMVVCHASMNTLIEKMAEKKTAGDIDSLGDLAQSGSEIGDINAPTNAELSNPDNYFARLRDLINNEEDLELASAQIEKIKAYLTWYAQTIEESKVDYKWMTERLLLLKDRYEKMFLPYMKQSQQQERSE